MPSYSLLDEVWTEPFANPVMNDDEDLFAGAGLKQNSTSKSSTFSYAAQPTADQSPFVSTPNNLAGHTADMRQPIKTHTSIDYQPNDYRDQILMLQNRINLMEETLTRLQANQSQTLLPATNQNDVILYLATGAFFIFILDAFLKFGRRIQ